MDDAGHLIDQPLPPPPPPEAAHEYRMDHLAPELSCDQPMVIQFPAFADTPRPPLRGTETGQQS